MMATCKDCLHYEACKYAENLSDSYFITAKPYKNMKQWCDLFENKADFAPIKRGKWKLNKNGSGTCSECGITSSAVWDYDNWQSFCGHCGADMRGV